MSDFLKIHPSDNVEIALNNNGDIPKGHKKAVCNIEADENIIKYGYPIGHAQKEIKKGEWIHSHNLKTNLKGKTEYEFKQTFPKENITKCADIPKISAYKRDDGRIGIRNEIWIIPTVGCINDTARLIAEGSSKQCENLCDGVFALTHPYGCSQLGDDLKTTQKILAGLANNPNAGGVLILSLGCENNNLNSFIPMLGEYDKKRIKTLTVQDSDDEIIEGKKIVAELAKNLSEQKRTKVLLSDLTIGFKCGGSDGFSGITANPLCGRIADKFSSYSSRLILTEVPEMFGAEEILMSRAKNKKVFCDIVDMINSFKDYFTSHSQPVYENPSPGNKDGGITTLEEKSLGCVQKGGKAIITDVLKCGQKCEKSGLNLLYGPGNDLVSCTLLAASGAVVILFTSGRGTPFGGVVPTLKIATNTDIYNKKQNWFDFDAGRVLNGESFEAAANELESTILSIASYNAKTKNEINGYRQIAIFKDGVTL